MTASTKAQVAAGTDADMAEELFMSLYPKLVGWVRCLVDDDDTAHAIASEAFVRLLSRWTWVQCPQGYLYVTAANLAADHWRKAGRKRRASRSVFGGPRRMRWLAAHPRVTGLR